MCVCVWGGGGGGGGGKFNSVGLDHSGSQPFILFPDQDYEVQLKHLLNLTIILISNCLTSFASWLAFLLTLANLADAFTCSQIEKIYRGMIPIKISVRIHENLEECHQ